MMENTNSWSDFNNKPIIDLLERVRFLVRIIMTGMNHLKQWVLLLTFALGGHFSQPLISDNPPILVMTIDGAIAPVTQAYLERAIQSAERQNAGMLIMQLNTPGGSIQTMNEMVQDMRASRVPIVVYVAPRGAMAASAGTLITLAGHASAMAPETVIGAASPVGGQGEDLGATLKAKEMEALKATVRTLALYRGAEAVTLAEATIEKAKAVSADEALQAHLVDFIAADVADLVQKLDGFSVVTATGTRVLHTRGAPIQPVPMTLIEDLLQVLTNPNVVFILLSIGIQAIFIELSHPGGWVAGFIGVVCLALAGYGMGVLPVNWFGLVFLVIAFILFIVDIKAPTHGALTTAGVGSFIIGALVLFNSPATPPFQRVSLPLVIIIGILTGVMFAVVISFALRAQRTPIKTGKESLVGREGIALEDISSKGHVQAAGETWTVELESGSPEVKKNERVVVLEVRGLHLVVKKKM